jgi:hypothetical protein
MEKIQQSKELEAPVKTTEVSRNQSKLKLMPEQIERTQQSAQLIK